MTHHPGWLLTAAALFISGSSQAAIFAVNTDGDVVDGNVGDGVCAVAGSSTICTLRAALMEANFDDGLDIITIPAGFEITLHAGPASDSAAFGDLDITTSMSIIPAGSGPRPIIRMVSGASQSRLFEVHPSAGTVSFVSLELTGGETNNGAQYRGGAINVRPGNSQVNIVNCRIYDNTALQGAAISNSANMLIDRSEIFDNQPQSDDPDARGPAVYNRGQLVIESSTIRDNLGMPFGAPGPVDFRTAAIVATPLNAGTPLSTNINNSTVSGNIGGGVESTDGELIVTFSTIVENIDGYGLAITLPFDDNDELTLRGSVVANNDSDFGDCRLLGGDPSSLMIDYSADSDDSCLLALDANSLRGIAPVLAPLADNGGSTATHLPLDGSPLIDGAVSSGICSGMEDQRGVARPQDGVPDGVIYCDIGAVEVLGPPVHVIFADGFEG